MKRLVAMALAALSAEAIAQAQTLSNGSFEGGFADWTTAGVPTVVGAPPTPIDGGNQALIQSTGAAGTGSAAIGNSVDANTLSAFLGLSGGLPATRAGSAINGEAISQTLTVGAPKRLTFYYNYQTREIDGLGFDAAGFVLNGVYHELANGDSTNLTVGNSASNFAIGSGYIKVTVLLVAGANTISFVTYNTGNTATDTGLYVDDLFLSSASFRRATFTPNQNAVGGYVDRFAGVTTGNFGKLVNNLGALNGAGLASAFDEISPQTLQIFHRIAFDNATFTSQGLGDHLASLRDGLTGFDSSGMVVNDPSLAPMLSQISSRLLAWSPPAAQDVISDSPSPLISGVDLRDSKQMKAASGDENRWSTFVAGNVVLADIGHSDSVAHQDYTTGSVMLGADYRLTQNFTVGALLGYGHTDADLDHENSKATADTYSPGVYASFVDGPWYANGLFAYGYNSYTEDRHVAIGGLNGFNHGAPDGNQYTGNLSTGYEFQSGGFKFGPLAGVQYVNLGVNSFTEDGPTALNVQEQSAESLRSQLGFEGRYAVHTGSVTLTPHASAAWQHEFLDGSRGITSQFNQIGAGSFTVQTTAAGRDSALLDLGLDAGLSKTVSLFLDYQAEAGESDFFAQSVQAGVKLGF